MATFGEIKEVNEAMKKVDEATASEMGKYNIPGMGF